MLRPSFAIDLSCFICRPNVGLWPKARIARHSSNGRYGEMYPSKSSFDRLNPQPTTDLPPKPIRLRSTAVALTIEGTVNPRSPTCVGWLFHFGWKSKGHLVFHSPTSRVFTWARNRSENPLCRSSHTFSNAFADKTSANTLDIVSHIPSSKRPSRFW